MTSADTAFSLRKIAVPAYGPSLLFGIGEGAFLPVVPLTARDLGAAVPTAALVVGLIGVGSLISNIPASMLTMHRGERWAIVAAALAAAAAMVLCGLTGHLGAFAFGALVVGMAQAVFNLARQSYLTEAAPVAYRARALSTLGGVMRIGMFVGPFLGAAAIHAGGIVAAYVAGAAALLLAAGVASRMPELPSSATSTDTGTSATSATSATSVNSATSAPSALSANKASGAARPQPQPAEASAAAPRQPGWLAVFREHRHVFITLGVGVLLLCAVRSARQAVIPLWADHLLLDASMVSLIVGIAGGIEMLVFYPAGHVMDRKGRRTVAVPSMLIMGAALLCLPLTAGTWSVLAVACLIGFGNGLSSGLVMTLGADHSPRAGRAHFLGLWRLVADVGVTCGPAVLSLLTAVLSLAAGIAMVGVLALLGAAQLAYWIPRAGAQAPGAARETTPR